jgi:hypothetical protein
LKPSGFLFGLKNLKRSLVLYQTFYLLKQHLNSGIKSEANEPVREDRALSHIPENAMCSFGN